MRFDSVCLVLNLSDAQLTSWMWWNSVLPVLCLQKEKVAMLWSKACCLQSWSLIFWLTFII